MNLSHISLQPLSPLSRTTMLELRSVHLRDLGQFLEAVYHFPALEMLHLSDISWDSQKTDRLPASTPIGLHHLGMSGAQNTLTPVLQWLATIHTPPPLKLLRLRYPSQQNLAFVQAIITASALTLEHLALYANRGGQALINLSKNAMLRRLDFEGYYHEDSEFEHIISTIGSTNPANLKHISLPTMGPNVTVPLLRRIDGVITTERFSSLEYLRVPNPKVSPRVILSAETFPRAMSKGLRMVETA
ncbi:hypothetical protein C8J56DRAFT_944502 [Mycena floridula]|nr:hypothetical protein C8J56DRAFT_944502 [Mycena floridula]